MEIDLFDSLSCYIKINITSAHQFIFSFDSVFVRKFQRKIRADKKYHVPSVFFFHLKFHIFIATTIFYTLLVINRKHILLPSECLVEYKFPRTKGISLLGVILPALARGVAAPLSVPSSVGVATDGPASERVVVLEDASVAPCSWILWRFGSASWL